MSRMRFAAAALALAGAAPAWAQTAPVPVAAPVDPASHAIATRVAARLLPVGALAGMMRSTMDQMSNGLIDRMSEMPIGDLVKMAGIDEAEAEKLGSTSLKQVMEIIDPAYAERSRITTRVLMGAMVDIMAGLEPDYRAGLADALASRFTAPQLAELDRFFATPTGSAYAAQSMTLYADPAMMRRMDAMMPKIMAAMPALMKQVVAATAHLPKFDKSAALTSDQKARLDALLAAQEDKK